MSSNKRKRSTSSGKVTQTQVARSAKTSSSRYANPAEFNPDYSYVIKDLKRIGSLAGSFILILVILSFFLR